MVGGGNNGVKGRSGCDGVEGWFDVRVWWRRDGEWEVFGIGGQCLGKGRGISRGFVVDIGGDGSSYKGMGVVEGVAMMR